MSLYRNNETINISDNVSFITVGKKKNGLIITQLLAVRKQTSYLSAKSKKGMAKECIGASKIN